MTRITIPDEGSVVHIVNSPPRSLYLTTVCGRYEEDNHGELVGFWELSEEAVTCMACVAAWRPPRWHSVELIEINLTVTV